MTTQTKAITHAADCWSWGPAHYACAVREIERLREALKELITWIPSADTYRRLGFDPEAPMRVLGDARTALAQSEYHGRNPKYGEE